MQTCSKSVLKASNNYMCTCSILRNIAIQDMFNLEFDLPLKLKVNGAIGKPTYDLSVNNSKYMQYFMRHSHSKLFVTLSLYFKVTGGES